VMRRLGALLAGMLTLLGLRLAGAAQPIPDPLESAELHVARRAVLAALWDQTLESCPAPNGWRLYLWPRGEARRVLCWSAGSRIALLELRGNAPRVVWGARVANERVALKRLEANAFTLDLDDKPFNLLTDATSPFNFTFSKNTGDTLGNFFSSQFREVKGKKPAVQGALSYYLYIGRWGCGWHRTWGEVQADGNSTRNLVAGSCGGEMSTPWLGTPELFSKTAPVPAFETEKRTDR
jgi:hypothetical protein